MKIKLIRFLSLILLFLACGTMIFAEGNKKDKALSKVTGQPSYTHLNINNISTFFYNNGSSDISALGSSGLIYPKGSGKAASFQSGFLWGGKVDGEFRTGGSAYRQSTLPGRIIGSGAGAVAVNPEDPDVRIYRVRRDYKTGNLQDELNDGDGPTIDAIRAQYETDWNEWPADQGAPYEDVDGNGKYDPAIDIPGVVGSDQTVWSVCNDFDEAQSKFFYGALPMGIEEQITAWGYKATGALGNMIFRKYTLINKNKQSKPFTDMYVSMWSDIDLGFAGDDFAGCDTLLSLGYVYNESNDDNTYSPLPPPALGFDFFQGPRIKTDNPADTAIFKNQKWAGYKNLPMTSFYFFINPDPTYADPNQGNYNTGTLEWLNLFTGKVSTTGQPYTDPVSGKITMFPLSGDPATQTGWVDGKLHPAGDRRIGMVSGPFTMAYADTQEVVVAELAAGAIPGVDRIQAISLLKQYDEAAQIAYNRLFNLPRAPQQPSVTATGLDKQIILSWGSDIATVNKTENYSDFGYAFEGYNIYQLPSASAGIDQAKLLVTYDVVNGVKKIIDKVFDPSAGVPVDKVTGFGNDSGINRTFTINVDATKGNTPLLNGSKYYFAVTAYAYNEAPLFGPKVLENAISTFTVMPQTPNPGVVYTAQAGTVVTATHTSGVSDGTVKATVYDPTLVTGATYQVSFADDATTGNTVWSLKNTTANKTLLSNQTNISGDANYLLTDGVQVKVQGPEYLGVSFASTGTRWLSGNSANGGELMFGAAFLGKLFWGSSSVAPADLRSVHVDVFKVQSYVDANGNGKYDVGEIYTVDPAKGQLVNLYSTWGAGKWKKTVLIPMKFYSVEPDGTKRQIDVVVRDRDGNGQWDPDDGDTYAYNYLWALNTTYDPTGNSWNPTAGGRDFMHELYDLDAAPVLWTFWWVPRGTMEQFHDDFTMDFVAPKVLTKADVYTFTSPAVTEDLNKAKEDVAKINVFPNPYYGVNPQELNKYQRFVTFSHLPQKATLRIFNLAGQSVRTLYKDSPDQFFRWDLNNESSLPVASGLYLVYIDMPDLGSTKIVKVAVIQEQVIMDRF